MDMREVAEAFSRHDFTATYPHIADDVVWTNVSGPEFDGKQALIEACTESSEYLTGMKTEFTRFKVVVGADCVVIDSTADYTTPEGARSVIASCDLYDFSDGMMTAITSYTMEVEQPDDERGA